MSFIKILRDTAAGHAHNNFVLEPDQIALETDTGKVKIGDGVTNYVNLAYLNPTGLAAPYDLAAQVTGKPDSAAVVLKFVAVRAFTLLAAGHKASAGTGANAQADFILAVNGTTKATLRFAASGTTITIVGGTAAAIAIGDVITITAPTQDSALADIGFSLAGTLL